LRDGSLHIHPLNYLRGLAAEIERLGGTIFEQSPATEAHLAGPEKRVVSPGGEIRAERVVLTTGGYTDGLVPRLRRAMLPIATYVMLSEPAPDRRRVIAAAYRGTPPRRRLLPDENGSRLLGGRIRADIPGIWATLDGDGHRTGGPAHQVAGRG
jgi:hypothetical protein